MNSKTDVVRMWEDESWRNPPSSMISTNKMYHSDDFHNLDKDGNVMGDKAAFTAVSQLLYNAFTGFKGVVHDLQEEEDGSVTMAFHFEGMHSGDFDLSAMGMGVIPATGKRIVTPESKTRFMVQGGQIDSSQPISGGFEDLLAGIGVTPPSA
jgi:hypothetical protein